jgi:hypothetical protein
MAWVFGETALTFWRRNLTASAIRRRPWHTCIRRAASTAIFRIGSTRRFMFGASHCKLHSYSLQQHSQTETSQRIRRREFPLQLKLEAVSRCLYLVRQWSVVCIKVSLKNFSKFAMYSTILWFHRITPRSLRIFHIYYIHTYRVYTKE